MKFDPTDNGGSSDECVYQFSALGNDLELSFLIFTEKFLTSFPNFPYTPKKCAYMAQLCRVRSQQLLGVEKKVSPFWKLHK